MQNYCDVCSCLQKKKPNCLFHLQDWHAWQRANGWSRKDHDAEWRDIRHLHGHRYGDPLLRNNLGSLPTTTQLWDFSSNYPSSSLSAPRCLTLHLQSSFVNKSSDMSNVCQSGWVLLSDVANDFIFCTLMLKLNEHRLSVVRSLQ